MRIAQVAPLYESVPPRLYGGTERIVSYLTEELINQGHDVTLFATGDSKTNAKLVATIPASLRLSERCEDMLAPHFVQLEEVLEMQDQFDIIHFHTDYLNFPFSRILTTPHLTTLHGKLTIPELQLLYAKFNDQPLVSISQSQRKPLPNANFVATVHHGLPENLYKPGEGEDGYFAFLGRISPEKRCDRAIEIAIAKGIPINIAAKIDKADQEYFECNIKALFDHPLVNYIGEIGEKEKGEFLGKAKALLFPIDWDEPFGMVLIEAMACGTPVIAWNNGSVPEIIDNGETGFIVNDIQDAILAIDKLEALDRNGIRQRFIERFTARRMTLDYLKVYAGLVEKQLDLERKNLHAVPLGSSEKLIKAIS